MNFACAYPVDSAMFGSAPTGSSGTEEGEEGPIQVEILDVKAKVLGRPACARRRRDSVSAKIIQSVSRNFNLENKEKKR